MEKETIVSIEPAGIRNTYDISNLEEDFLINEPNYICEHFLVHNSGVIISDVDLDDKVPIIKNTDGDYFCGFQESGGCTDLLQAGFIKFDILGINNLDIIKEIVKEIDDKNFNYLDVPEDRPEVFDVLDKDCNGLFQISSPLYRKLINEIKPKTQDEITDLIAIGRPGALKADADKKYLANKKKKPDKIPKFIEDAVFSSHYVLLYQEQVMKIFMNLGFSEREADEVRGMLKKIQKMKLGRVTPEERKRLKQLNIIES